MSKGSRPEQPILKGGYVHWEGSGLTPRKHFWHKPDAYWLECLIDIKLEERKAGSAPVVCIFGYQFSQDWETFEKEYNAPGASERRAEATLRKRQGDKKGILGQFEWLQVLARYVDSPWGPPFPPPFNPEGWSSKIYPPPLKAFRTAECYILWDGYNRLGINREQNGVECDETIDVSGIDVEKALMDLRISPELWQSCEIYSWQDQLGVYPFVEEVAELLGRKIAGLILRPDHLEELAEHATRKTSRESKALRCSWIEDTLGIFLYREQRLPTKKELNIECNRWAAAHANGEYRGAGPLVSQEHGAPVHGGFIYRVRRDPYEIRREGGGDFACFLCPESEWNHAWEENVSNFGTLLKELGMSGLPKAK